MEIWTIFRQLAGGSRQSAVTRSSVLHGAVGVQQQVREEAALPGTSEPERKTIPAHFERAE